MSDRPIIFSGPMVRALLDGRKTQTRRVLDNKRSVMRERDDALDCVRFHVGDRLYVRESLVRQETDQGVGYQTFAADGRNVWPLTTWHHQRRSIPSIHMPRWASRLTLTVTDVRVQRLQDISEADAMAEGAYRAGVVWACGATYAGSARLAFSGLWGSLHDEGQKSWDANPWVVALTFTVEHRNIDAGGPHA